MLIPLRLSTSQDLLRSIEQRIQFATDESEAHKKHQADVEARQEELKKTLKVRCGLCEIMCQCEEL